MRLKYYLRGIGVGVIVTTILFMILISVKQTDAPRQDSDGESKTIADFENDAQYGEGTETGQGGQPADAQQGEGQTDGASDSPQPESRPDDGSDSPQPESQPDDGSDSPQAENQPDGQQMENQPSDTQPEENQKVGKVRFIISGGEYSDVICQKLKEAGLIDDADAYNKFLVEENYDNFINPGVYDIPKNATYEEIAVLLTTKVE